MTADHVLLQALEGIHLAADGGVGEHLRGLLERGGRHEAVGPEGGAGDALQHLVGGGGDGVAGLDRPFVGTLEERILVAQLADRHDLAGVEVLGIAGVGDDLLVVDRIVLLEEFEFVHELFGEEAGVARIHDLDLAHHLAAAP